MLLLASSPYRRTGSLWDSYQRHHGKDGSRVLTWQAATLEMNPALDPRVVEEAYEDDPESAASEYGAEFRTDIADFVSRAVVEACLERGVHERPPARAAGQVYSAFVDASGGSGSDSMTMAIASTQQGLPTLSAIREIRPPFQPDSAVVLAAARIRVNPARNLFRAPTDITRGGLRAAATNIRWSIVPG